MSEDAGGITRQQLAINLLEIIQQEELKEKKELVKFPLRISCSVDGKRIVYISL